MANRKKGSGMSGRKPLLIGLAVTVLLAGPPVLIAESAEADFTAQCEVCHGPDGVSRWSDIPNISGLPEVVVANALYDFRGRARPCRVGECGPQETCPDASMCYVSHELDDGEIDRYATYYSSQPFSPSAPDTELDPEVVAAGREVHDRLCEACHTQGGSSPLDQASILRGQNTAYLRNAMADFREGRRVQEAAMAEAMAVLSDGETEALLQFYASPMR
jgi:sulfide dehydrogenase cytochrome subunit